MRQLRFRLNESDELLDVGDLARLLAITKGCRDDMHEPDEQDLYAKFLGQTLDNAFGDDPTTNHGELTIGLNRDGKEEWFNLANLIALARKAKVESLDDEILLREYNKLVEITKNCREDMHEPAENGVGAWAVGDHLDNAFGCDPKNNCREFLVGISKSDFPMYANKTQKDLKIEFFNLATLIAIARKSVI